MRRAGVLLTVVILLAGYLYISGPGKVVVNEKGRVPGLVNKGRALVQGNHFWERQLKIATEIYNSDTAPHLPSSSEMQALYHKFREEENALNEKMKDLYTPEEKMAMMYRIKADSISRAGKWRISDEAAESVRVKDADKYKSLIPVIERKIHKGKTDPGKN